MAMGVVNHLGKCQTEAREGKRRFVALWIFMRCRCHICHIPEGPPFLFLNRKTSFIGGWNLRIWTQLQPTQPFFSVCLRSAHLPGFVLDLLILFWGPYGPTRGNHDLCGDGLYQKSHHPQVKISNGAFLQQKHTERE